MQFIEYINQSFRDNYSFQISSVSKAITFKYQKTLEWFAKQSVDNIPKDPKKLGKILIKCTANNMESLSTILTNGGADLKVTNSKGWSLLRVALCARKANLVHYLINCGVSIRECPEDMWTPLRIAIKMNDKNMIELLLLNGAKLEETYAGRTVLDEAMFQECHEAVEFFIDKDISLDIQGPWVEYYFLKKCENNHSIEYFQKLVNVLKKNGFDFKVSGEKGLNKLLTYYLKEWNKEAILKKIEILLKAGSKISLSQVTEILGNILNTEFFIFKEYMLKSLQELLRLGADPNGKIVDKTFVEFILEKNEKESVFNVVKAQCLKELLKKGAKIETNSVCASNYLYDIIKDGDNELFKLFVEAGSMLKQRHLSLAVAYQRKEMVRLMLDKGLGINDEDEYGCTPLISILSEFGKEGVLSMVEWLIQNGADVNQTCMKTTPLFEAADNHFLGEQEQIVRCLIKHKADFNIPCEKFNKTALTHNVGKNRLDMVKALVENGADVNAIDNEGTPLLGIALCQPFDPDKIVAKYLLAKGADRKLLLNNPNLLLGLSREGDLKHVKLFLENKVSPNIQDAYGKTPLHYAAQYGHLAVVKELLTANADPNIRDNDGLTPKEYPEVDEKIMKLL